MYQESITNRIRPVAASVLPYDSASPREAEMMHTVNQWIRVMARKLEIPFCDTNHAVANPINENKLCSYQDGLHPDVKGYRAMGEALTLTIESDLARR